MINYCLKRFLKNENTIYSCSITVLPLSSCTEKKELIWTLVPTPNNITVQPGAFSFDQGVGVSNNSNRLDNTVEHFTKKFENLGIKITNESVRRIHLEITDSQFSSEEAYELSIDSEQIKITASNPRTRHQRQDAFHRAAHERRRSVRNRSRRLRAQTRAAVRERKLPALGFARRISRARRFTRAPEPHPRQRPRKNPRRHTRRIDRQIPAQQQVPHPPPRRH